MLALQSSHTHMLTQYVSIVFVRTYTKSLDANNKAHAQPKLTANARNKAVNQNPFFSLPHRHGGRRRFRV